MKTLTLTEDQWADIRMALILTSNSCANVAAATGSGETHDTMNRTKWKLLTLAEHIEKETKA